MAKDKAQDAEVPSREDQEAALKKAGLALHLVSAAQTKAHIASGKTPKARRKKG